ncbi:MAG: hypothetical protein U0893_09260 [Chloroflexota bacterium]
MAPAPESQEQARQLDERAERIRAQLRAQPGFRQMIETAQAAEREGRTLTPEQIHEQFEIAD